MLIVDKHGREYEHDGTVLPDGARLKTSMMAMDSMQKATARSAKPPLVVDGHGDSDLYALSRPGPRYSTQRTTADVNRRLAYEDAEEIAADAWKTPPVKPAGGYPPEGAKVGAICTINGQPGHLRERDGGLVCVADDEQQDAHRTDDREAAYREVQMRDEDAWRNAK